MHTFMRRIFPITRAQRVALKRIYDRGPIWSTGHGSSAILSANGWDFDWNPPVAGIPGDWRYTHPEHGERYMGCADEIVQEMGYDRPLTWREFRRLARPMIGGDGCILVPWAGMTLGVEPDGYTHS